jgi:hypothetical protein
VNQRFENRSVHAGGLSVHAGGLSVHAGGLSIKVLMILGMLSVLMYFKFSANNILFLATISTFVGSCYYILTEEHPHLLWLFNVILKYKWKLYTNRIRNKVTNLFQRKPRTLFDRWGSTSTIEQINRSESDMIEGFNFVKYYDQQMDKHHIMIFKESMRSNDLMIFKDEMGQDITNFLEPYLGPLQNFHGSDLTPDDFKHERITVFRDGEINVYKTFERYEKIKLV